MRTRRWYAAAAAPVLLFLLNVPALAQQPRMILVVRGGMVVPVLALRSGLVGGDERRGVGSLFAGELESWPARNLGLRLGAEREATPIHYGGLESGDATVTTVGGSLLVGRARSDRRGRAYAALGGGMRLFRIRQTGSSAVYEHGSPAVYMGGGGNRDWAGLEIGLELGAWFASYRPEALPNPGPRATQADGAVTVRLGLPLLGPRR